MNKKFDCKKFQFITNAILFFGVYVFIAGLAIPANPARAEELSVRPGVNKQYENPDFNKWVKAFERSGRDIFDKRHEILAAAELRAGMAVADIGAGTGLFTRLFSQVTGPAGKVYAVDISPEFIKNIMRINREQGLNNVVGIVNTPHDVTLPPNSIDLAFICGTYHHFEYPYTIMQSVHRALRPRGILVVIDFWKIPGVSSNWIIRHVRAGKKTVIKEIEAAGFILMDEKAFLKNNYFLRFRKRENKL
ncbi:MAG: methyltransferase domain-containing protein [Gammaproteobacteria bacterium]|nr:methyltransferase domain-containing protein [Gammaproteobacteria bacterium]